MQDKMVLVLVLVAASAPMMLQGASVESSRADLVEPLQQQESAEVGNQLESAGAIGSAESELDDILSDDNSMGTSDLQLQDQRWSDEGEKTSGSKQQEGSSASDQDTLDSNIENAKIEMGQQDLATAAGYHHHHGHHVHGKMSMGAHSGHKGAFGWHAKFPVGGKGRR